MREYANGRAARSAVVVVEIVGEDSVCWSDEVVWVQKKGVNF